MTYELALILTIFGCVALGLLSILIVYLISLAKRSNTVMKKVDYLVEDFTYKSESLNVAVDAITKISSYVLTFDSLTKKGFAAIMKLVSKNRNYFYSFLDNLRSKKKNTDDDKSFSSKKISTSKKPISKKKSTKPKPKLKTKGVK